METQGRWSDSANRCVYGTKPESLRGGRPSMESDHRYYLRRASEERRAAERSLTAEARERHRELAVLFASKAEQRAPKRAQLAS